MLNILRVSKEKSMLATTKRRKKIERKLDACNNQTKKENSKKAFIRRVQYYKRRWKEQKEKSEIPLPPTTT